MKKFVQYSETLPVQFTAPSYFSSLQYLQNLMA